MSSRNSDSEHTDSSRPVGPGEERPSVDSGGRRDVLRILIGAVGSISVLGMAPVVAGCEISRVNAAAGGDIMVNVSSLVQDNDALALSQNGPDGAPILIVRVAADSFRALSMRCQHQGCTVGTPVNQQIVCPCHGSTYALDGAVLQGPTTAPLPQYVTTYDAVNHILTVHT